MRNKIEISKSNLIHNYHILRNAVKKEIIAVLKDNAYGHDLLLCAKTLVHVGIKMIAVATLDEALLLRKNGINVPILLFERCQLYATLYQQQITCAVLSFNHLEELCQSGYPLKVHLKIETGFHRFGLEENELPSAIALLKKSTLQVKGIYTHYAALSSYESQKSLFIKALHHFKNTPLLVHTQSSFYVEKPEDFTSCVRVGIALFGFHPTLPVLPVLSLYAAVLRVHAITQGQSVSYDYLESAPFDGFIFTLGIGYGDGWSPQYKTLGYQDKFYQQLGKTNMDVLLLFSKTEIKEMSFIELIGNHVTVRDLCIRYDVSPYVFLTSLSSRIPRILIP